MERLRAARKFVLIAATKFQFYANSHADKAKKWKRELLTCGPKRREELRRLIEDTENKSIINEELAEYGNQVLKETSPR